MKLTIFTPVIRPEGAIRAARSVQAANPHPWDLEHRLCYWSGPPDPSRARVAAWMTKLMDTVRDGWIVFVDDDSLLHPDLPARLADLVAAHADATVFCFDMLYPEMQGGVLVADPKRVKPGSIDGGQVALHYWQARAFPWAAGDTGDGIYLRRLYLSDPGAWVFVNEPLTMHNAQNWT